jgi:hypothetical protein
MADAKNPLSFVSCLFEIAVWPFQEASQYSAKRLSLHDQRVTLILLLPATLLFLPISVFICVVAVAFVFVVLPVVSACQGLVRLFARSPENDQSRLKPTRDG